MTDKNTQLSKCLPFIIGVTGHRNIDTSSVALKDSIRDSLIAWHNHIDNNTPIWLLNGLAAGADLLVAEVALELQEEWGQGKLKIIGCLPMPEKDYKADFENLEYAPDATKDFERVVDQIRATNGEVFAVRATLSDSDYQYAIKDTTYGKLRNSLYLNQGLFVAKYSNVLLSLWDGKAAKGAGGTADVTHYKLGKKIEWPNHTENNALDPVSDFDGQTAGLVHHLFVDRYQAQGDKASPEAIKFTPSTFSMPLVLNASQELSQAPGKLYDSVQNEGQTTSVFSSFITDEFSTLIEQLKTYNAMVAEHVLKKDQDQDQSVHDIADSIAGNYQQKYRKMTRVFLVISVVGYVCYELIGSFIATTPEIRGGLILIVLLMIGLAGGVILFTKNRDWKWKYQLARGVAEGGRIRSGLNIADVPPSSAPLIPRAFRSHLALLTHAISITEFEWWRNKIPYSHGRFQSEVIFWEIVKSQIKSQWINSQSEFLGNRLSSTCQSLSEFIYKRPKLAAEQMSLWAKGCFLGAIYSGSVIFALLITQYFMNTNIFNKPIDYLMLLVQFGLVMGGVIALWNELAGYESTAKGYASLKALYDRADKLLEGEFTASKHQMLLELAREAIFEHVSWTMSESNNDLKKK
ncbi:hypothetical protein [Shewanella ulleungensis]|uniref:hypothetical protein n=1 Tax=Shewanella ulleungensis TaxID=2282699 RepID=UPI003D792406